MPVVLRTVVQPDVQPGDAEPRRAEPGKGSRRSAFPLPGQRLATARPAATPGPSRQNSRGVGSCSRRRRDRARRVPRRRRGCRRSRRSGPDESARRMLRNPAACERAPGSRRRRTRNPATGSALSRAGIPSSRNRIRLREGRRIQNSLKGCAGRPGRIDPPQTSASPSSSTRSQPSRRRRQLPDLRIRQSRQWGGPHPVVTRRYRGPGSIRADCPRPCESRSRLPSFRGSRRPLTNPARRSGRSRSSRPCDPRRACNAAARASRFGSVTIARNRNSILAFGMPGLHVDVFVAEVRVQLVAVRMKRPQVDDRDDAEVFQVAQASSVGCALRYSVSLTLKRFGMPPSRATGCAHDAGRASDRLLRTRGARDREQKTSNGCGTPLTAGQ